VEELRRRWHELELRASSLTSQRNEILEQAIGSPASHKPQSFIHHRTLPPRHHSLPIQGGSVTHVSGTICYLCLRPLMEIRLRFRWYHRATLRRCRWLPPEDCAQFLWDFF
jgi:hypothetical protein